MNEILKHQISRHDDIFFHSFQGQNRKAFPKRFTVSTEKHYIYRHLVVVTLYYLLIPFKSKLQW